MPVMSGWSALPVASIPGREWDDGYYSGSDTQRHFGVSDRLLYRPGETVHFRIWSRERDGNRLRPFAGKAGDDFGMMREVMTRRFRNFAEGEENPEAKQGGHETVLPDLILIDGGKGQLSSVMRVLTEIGIADEIAVVGVAKGPHHGREGREVFHFPDGREKMLPVNSPLLFHLQNLRDEVHRYVIGAHRAKRSKAITASPLDEIPGIGPSRKRALLLHFGTASKVRAASLEDLQRAPGVSSRMAQLLFAHWDHQLIQRQKI